MINYFHKMNFYLKNSYSWNLSKLLKICFIIILIGVFGFLIVAPLLTKGIVKHVTQLLPGHYVRATHEKAVPFSYKLYFWNVTNPEEVQKGGKPKLKEIGPYFFWNMKIKKESFDNGTDDSWSFNLVNNYYFHPELSNTLTGDEIITVIHPILVAATVRVQIEQPSLLNMVIEGLDVMFDNPSSMFLTATAKQLMYEGVDIYCNHTKYIVKKICSEISSVAQVERINDDIKHLRFSLLKAGNGTKLARYTVGRGKQSLKNIGYVVAINEHPLLSKYVSSKCNQINGTDKTLFPPFQRKEDIIWVYSHEGCISLPCRYEQQKIIRGTKAYLKTITLDDPLLDPDCNCNKYAGCIAPKGSRDMHSCLGFFSLGTFPHFYLADSSLKDAVEGMNPKKELHQSGIYFDLITGLPPLTLERFQISLLMKPIPEYPLMQNVNEMWMPFFWFEESFAMNKLQIGLVIVGQGALKLSFVTGILLIAVGCIGTLLTFSLYILRYREANVPKVIAVIPESETTIQITNKKNNETAQKLKIEETTTDKTNRQQQN